VIEHKITYAQSLIDDFSIPAKAPHIAISVDMLDTGIDVPEVVNLVFFKIVRSKTKFWQMIGRGTRLRPDLFGPGRHKEHFFVFDFCQNFEFFNQNPVLTEGALGISLAAKLFKTRVELVGEIAQKQEADEALSGLRQSITDRLFDEVAAMSLDNFIVRPQRRFVEKFQARNAWQQLGPDERAELAEHIAGLPSAYEDDDLAAKQFDYLVLQAQLAVLRSDPPLVNQQARIMGIASRLEELSNVPMVAAEMALILEVQTDEFWQDINLPILENARRRLRQLVKLIEPKDRTIVYTDFEDEIGAAVDVTLPNIGAGTDKARFLMKVRHFLTQHENHITIQKLRRNEQLTPQDLSELERMFVAESVGSPEDLERVRSEGGLGLFVRSLVGLDREAAKQALAGFVSGRTLSANQIEFIDLIIDYLTDRGVMDPRRLYESPFTDVDDQGVSGVFTPSEVKIIVDTLAQVKAKAAA
jgi:type I restriction enzyme R subunit